jgi:hypothetical protein
MTVMRAPATVMRAPATVMWYARAAFDISPCAAYFGYLTPAHSFRNFDVKESKFGRPYPNRHAHI